MLVSSEALQEAALSAKELEPAVRDYSKSLGLKAESLPRHVAVIMDGNGRWAKSRLFPRVEGHRAGARTVRMTVEECRKLGIRYLTLFSFSTENWLRPKEEVSALMKLFAQYLESEEELLQKNQIRLRAIGDRTKLPDALQRSLEGVESRTLRNTGMDLVLAISYGGRDEIVAAARALAVDVERGAVNAARVDANLFRSYLYAPDIPDPDLLIRTSDECRVSNFLLWQVAYSEIVVSPRLWPEFSKADLVACLKEYAGRRRRFGRTDEQIAGGVNGIGE